MSFKSLKCNELYQQRIQQKSINNQSIEAKTGARVENTPDFRKLNGTSEFRTTSPTKKPDPKLAKKKPALYQK